jgi:hypothetical protein
VLVSPVSADVEELAVAADALFADTEDAGKP